MLQLTFKEDETLRIGDDITIKTSRPRDRDDYGYSKQVKLEVDAPKHVKLLREELLDTVRKD